MDLDDPTVQNSPLQVPIKLRIADLFDFKTVYWLNSLKCYGMQALGKELALCDLVEAAEG